MEKPPNIVLVNRWVRLVNFIIDTIVFIVMMLLLDVLLNKTGILAVNQAVWSTLVFCFCYLTYYTFFEYF